MRLSTQLFVLAALITWTASCPGQTRMPGPEQENIRETLQHRSRQLSVSMYWGPFFRDARYLLLSEVPPEHISLLNNPKGERIHPGDALGVLPAGTKVRISEVEFATAVATTTRSLITPKFFTWVILDVPSLDRPALIVIRDEPNNHDGFLKILSRHLTTDDVNAELQKYPEEIRHAISEKRLILGMDEKAARMSWGNPLQVTKSRDEGILVELWRFEGGRVLTIRDGKLVSWDNNTDS